MLKQLFQKNVMLVVAALGVLFLFEMTAEAQTCQGASCNGVPPSQSVCNNDATVIGQMAIKDWNNQTMGYVSLMHSPDCETI